MKTPILLLALASSAFGGTPVLARPTAEAISRLHRDSPMSSLERPEPASASPARPAAQSILRDSVILHDGENWTIIPHGAVIYLPEALSQRVNAKPLGKLLPWSGFLANNTAWLSVSEVTFDQAAGKEPLATTTSAGWAEQNKIVVAVHHQGPISVQVDKQLPSLTQR